MPQEAADEKTFEGVYVEKPQCHIHDEVSVLEVGAIRQNVCAVDEVLIEHDNGKYYCFLHLPSEDKDAFEFKKIFRARLDSVREKAAAVGKLPEADRKQARRELSYDFRYVWFPHGFKLGRYDFEVSADFTSATFAGDVRFSRATFSGNAFFKAATFSGAADFNWTTFSDSADYELATFSGKAGFDSATFLDYADFKQAKFHADADFNSSKFSKNAYFNAANFAAAAFFSMATFSAEASFRVVTFSTFAHFASATFSGNAAFNSAVLAGDAFFSETTFAGDADFNRASFSAAADFVSASIAGNANFVLASFAAAANFYAAKFLTGANFSSAKFSAEADFRSARFPAGVEFRASEFLPTSQVFFGRTRLGGEIDFQYTLFAGYTAFEGEDGQNVFLDEKKENQEAVLNLRNARLEKPERISFHRVRLCPSWFVNTDARKMIFTDIRWSNLDAKLDNSNIIAEVDSLKRRDVSEPMRLLEIACRQLSVNAEENNRYEEASKFRYMAMETKRLEYWGQGRFWTLNWWYRFSSGYGENWKRAWLVLLGVLLFFGLLYWSPLSTFDYGEKKDDTVLTDVIEKESDWTRKYDDRFHHMNLGEGLVHSVYVAALQRPEPKAADVLTRLFIILETIFAPLQAALLALAIRRKFMR